MTAEAHRSFGPYQIKSVLGSGGMGEVYLAEDPRLRRRVAIKILPAVHAADADRRARFVNEARAASALHHPHIVTMYDIGVEDGVDYMVMEYIDGQTLRDMMRGRGLSSKTALDIAAQVANGLAAAHAAGIVHRDIKPENIMVGRDGSVKILDYGVAKLTEEAPLDPKTGARTAVQVTTPGTLVGTIGYMSPEQIEGKPLDARSDIFSLGTVLYEMLGGHNPFAGLSSTDTLQKILNAPPPLEEFAGTPRVREILGRTLQRNPADRYQHAGDMSLDLRRAISAPETGTPERQQRRTSLLVPALIAGLVSGSLATIIVQRRMVKAPATQRISFTPLTGDPGYEGEPTFSPDGQTIAYVSDRTGNLEIFLKQISGGPDINLTNNPADDVQPSFSPDGKQIAFVSTRSSVKKLVYRNPTVAEMGGDIWVMPALGGVPRRIAEDGNFPAWSPDGASIIFTRGPWLDQRIYRIGATGGEAVALPIRTPVQHVFLTHANYSPDGKWITFDSQQPDKIYVVPAAGGAAIAVGNGADPTWDADSRSVIYTDTDPGRNSTLSRVRIDDKGNRSGASEPLTSGRGADRWAAVSRDGKSLVFGAQTISFNIERVPFDGERGRITGSPEALTRGSEINPFFTISPDATAIAFQSQRGLRSNIWRKDLGTGAITQLTSDARFADLFPSWSLDGKEIAFARNENGTSRIYVMSSDGANPHALGPVGGFEAWMPGGRRLAYYDFVHHDVRVLDLTNHQTRVLANEGSVRTLHQFSNDGHWMVYQAIGPTGTTGLRVVATTSTHSRVLVATPLENGHPFFSPDGRWVYYQTNHKNLYRIPGPGQDWKQARAQQVTFFPESDLYLEHPQLSRDGKYLYYSRRANSSDLWLGRFER